MEDNAETTNILDNVCKLEQFADLDMIRDKDIDTVNKLLVDTVEYIYQLIPNEEESEVCLQVLQMLDVLNKVEGCKNRS